jgi:ribonuclease PH
MATSSIQDGTVGSGRKIGSALDTNNINFTYSNKYNIIQYLMLIYYNEESIMTYPRKNNRKSNQMREIKFTSNFNKYAAGSVLSEYGDTKVLCNASIIESVPKFIRTSNKRSGWLTAEYSMLPGATISRNDREAVRGKQSGRTQEIQRLIGRCLRSCINLQKLGEITIAIDCDVLQADGGTRTAAISGAYIAMVHAIQNLQYKKVLLQDPVIEQIAAVSVGIVNNHKLLDLDYSEDSQADTDMNIVMTKQNQFIEIQGTAEKNPITKHAMLSILELAELGITEVIRKQNEAILNNIPEPISA